MTARRTRFLPFVLVGALMLTLSGRAPAQLPEVDPRAAADPRAGVEPRAAPDPRQADVDVQQAARSERQSGPLLFDDLYSRGEFPALTTAIRSTPWQVLGWVDRLADDWLRLVERDEDEDEDDEDAHAARERLLGAARLCDQALGDTTFQAHAERLTAWNRQQVAAYRAAQALYAHALTLFTEAPSAEAARQAKTPLTQALERLRPLGPTWEATSTRALLGRIEMANGESSAARATMKLVVQQGGQVRHLDAVWEGLAVLYRTALENRDYDGAESVLKDQYRISIETGDQGLTAMVVDRLSELTAFRNATGL